MIFRQALLQDVPHIQVVRNSVKENMLSDPKLVSDKDCEEFIMVRGKGWVCEKDNKVIGFAIADLQDNNIWALFLKPEFEGLGIGRKLQEIMLDWYFSMDKEKVWLGTAPGTRSEKFYKKSGWKETGIHREKEIKFEMTRSEWMDLKKQVPYSYLNI